MLITLGARAVHHDRLMRFFCPKLVNIREYVCPLLFGQALPTCQDTSAQAVTYTSLGVFDALRRRSQLALDALTDALWQTCLEEDLRPIHARVGTRDVRSHEFTPPLN